MVTKKCALIKISGDVADREELYKELSSIGKQNDLFVICGAGTAITAKLEENKIPFKFEGSERVIKSEKGKELAYDVLEEKRAFVENKLLEQGVRATVCSPAIKFGRKTCHVNGDNFVRMTHRNFDKVFIFTLKGRNKSSLGDIENIEIVCL